MPGPHLELKIMKTFDDMAGCDCWMGSYWLPNQQWWIGRHYPRGLSAWRWPSDEWRLIGYEKWYQPHTGEPKLRLLP